MTASANYSNCCRHETLNITFLTPQAGYTGMVLDSATAWLQQLDKLADEHKIIPRYTPKRELTPLPEAQRQE